MQRALLLDRNYMVLSLVPWKRAVKLMVKGKAEAVQGSGSVASIQGVDGKFSVPSILRLLVVIPWKAHMGRMRFARKNVLIRDNNKCLYCGIRVGKNTSIDHIIPRSRGGKTDYKNCVTCCKECNNKKADRTPKEAGMKLKNKPRRPTFMSLYRHYLKSPPEEWCNYIIGLKDESNI